MESDMDRKIARMRFESDGVNDPDIAAFYAEQQQGSSSKLFPPMPKLTGDYDTVPDNGELGLAHRLNERGQRYGRFTDHASVTMALKRVIWGHHGHNGFTDDQIEALDMICHKIGRIVCGDPDYADSWIDVAGYATLVANRLKETDGACQG